MFGKSVGKKLVNLVILLNWYNVGVGIMCDLFLVLIALAFGDWIVVHTLWRFLNDAFSIYHWSYIIVLVTGLVLPQIGLNVLLTNAVEKCDEMTLTKWLKRSVLYTMVEWSLIGLILFYNWNVSYICMTVGCIPPIAWIYIVLRIIYPVLSHSIIFWVYFNLEIKLCFRSDDCKIIHHHCKSVGKKLVNIVKLVILLNWFNVGVGILCDLLLLSLALNFGEWSEWTVKRMLWHFLSEAFRVDRWSYPVVLVTGLVLPQIGLNVRLSKGVKKCDELTLTKWLKRSVLYTVVEWSIIAFIFYHNWNIRYICTTIGCIPTIAWIYIVLRIIYPVVSHSILFWVYFYFEVKLYFRSDDCKIIQG